MGEKGEGSGGEGGGKWGEGGGNWEWGTPLSTPSLLFNGVEVQVHVSNRIGLD